MPTDEAERYAEAVLDLVERIPSGRVMSYGAIAAVVGSGPRRVGRVLSLDGGGVPWWRVVHADGTPPPCSGGRAETAYAAEGTPLRPSGRRVDMVLAAWEPDRG